MVGLDGSGLRKGKLVSESGWDFRTSPVKRPSVATRPNGLNFSLIKVIWIIGSSLSVVTVSTKEVTRVVSRGSNRQKKDT